MKIIHSNTFELILERLGRAAFLRIPYICCLTGVYSKLGLITMSIKPNIGVKHFYYGVTIKIERHWITFLLWIDENSNTFEYNSKLCLLLIWSRKLQKKLCQCPKTSGAVRHPNTDFHLIKTVPGTIQSLTRHWRNSCGKLDRIAGRTWL